MLYYLNQIFIILGGLGISIPIPRSYKKIRDEMREGVNNGKYEFGVLVEPKIYKKFRLKDKQIVPTIYTVEGRKILLQTIRENTFKKHAAMGILRDQDHYERKLLAWSDHAETLGIIFF